MIQISCVILQESWTTIGSLAFGFIGIIATILTVLFRKKVLPRYYIRNKNIVSGINEIKEISLTYSDKKILNFSISDILFWNKGSKTLENTMFAEKDPFRISISQEYEILDIQLIYVSKESNNVDFKLVDNEIFISFDYLDKDEGFIVQILHTGVSNECMSLLGTIKGLGNFSENFNQKLVYKRNLVYRFYKLILRKNSIGNYQNIDGTYFVLPTVLMLYGIFAYFVLRSMSFGWILPLIILLISFAGYYSEIITIMRKVPKKFIEYINDDKAN